MCIHAFVLLIALAINGSAQEKVAPEKYGHTLNLGAGVGYYGYVGRVLPMATANYEFDVVKNFTLAPFLGCYSYQNSQYWGNPNKPSSDPSYHAYYYREVAVPVGVKGSYYFDQLLNANEKWDFYVATSVGFVFRSVTWDSNYYGDKQVSQSETPLYINMHIGAEYHINKKTGLYLDLSTGVSTFGLSVHF